MVTYFEDLGELAATNGIGLQICFSSRHYPHIDIRNGLRITLEDQPGHEQDLEKYVRNCLKTGRRSDAVNIQTQILEKASGVFMWVVLVVDILNKEYNRGRIFAVKRRLSEIPGKLSELFKDILTRDNDNMEDLLLCIQWILYAKRPLNRQEFYFAILSGLSNEELIEYDPERITPDDLDRFVVSSSKGLAGITKSEYKTIQFIHEYATEHMLHHANVAADEISQQNFLDQFPLQDWIRLNNMFEQHHTRHYTPNANLTYILAEWDFVKLLEDHVLKHPHVHIKGERHDFPLFAALFNGHRLAAKTLLGQAASPHHYESLFTDPNYKKNFAIRKDQGPLHWAIENKHTALARILITSNDLALTMKDATGRTALHSAAFFGDEVTMALLIERFDEFHHPSLSEMTPTHAAQKINKATANVFIDRGAFIDAIDEQNATALFLAAENGFEQAVKTLLDNMASTNCADKYGRTPLHRATEEGYEAVVRVLLENGALTNCSDQDGRTPLHRAAECGHEAIVRTLLENGASADCMDEDGETPLHQAAVLGYEAVVRALLDNGASANCADKYGRTPLHQAAEKGYEAVVKVLLENGASADCMMDENCETPLHQAAVLGNEAVVRALLDNGASANCADKYGRTPLHQAAEEGYEALVKVLLENGASADCADKYSQTPLHRAVECGHEAIVRTLLENGASANCAEKNGRTPLYQAALRGNEAVVRALLENGASADLADKYGKTPLHQAAALGYEGIVRVLHENGASADYTDEHS
ncbi:hypothetical protein EsH8_X_000657 [Colletotrichum jinshuiense]